MDQTDWKIINQLYEDKNITKAAKNMYISQPALTYRIKSIEEKLDIIIIQRSKKGIKFTPEGEYLAQKAKEMEFKFEKIKDRLKNLNNDDEGLIRLGVSTNFARFMLPTILKDFLALYPKVQFSVVTDWSKSIVKLAEEQKIHFSITRGNRLWEHEKILLKKEPICIVSQSPIDLEDLPNQSRIIYNTDPTLKQTIDQWWLDNFSVPPKITMHIDNIETCTKLVESGLGYAIIPSISLTEKNNLNKLALKNKDNETIHRDTWLFYHEMDTQYPVVRKFKRFLIEMFNAEQYEENKNL